MSQKSYSVCDLCGKQDTDWYPPLCPILIRHGSQNEEDWIEAEFDICQDCWDTNDDLIEFWAQIKAFIRLYPKSVRVVDRNDMLGLGHRDDDDEYA